MFGYKKHIIVALNQNPVDIGQRNRYLFTAVTTTFTNGMGTWNHDDDTAVDGFSARGDHLGPYVQRHNANLTYNGGIGIMEGAPHQAGLNPLYFGNVIQFLKG